MDLARSLSSAQDPALTAIVGWDNPLQTFFSQVFDPAIAEDEEADLLWVGTALQAIPTVAALQTPLAGWATIPADVLDGLIRDQQAATPPTALQQWMLQFLHGVGETCHGGPTR